MKKRTKLCDRTLPDYTRGEEIFNTVTHIVGSAMSVAILTLCVAFAFLTGDPFKITGAFIYGFSSIILYTMSSVYHGITKNIVAKKVMQILDHCTIFILIAGTYTPIVLSPIREVSPVLGWTMFGIVWGAAVIGIILNAIDLKMFSTVSMILYIAIGWFAVLTAKTLIDAVTLNGFILILSGGIAYTVGAVLYGLGARGGHRYMHSVFHIFVVIGTFLQFLAIFCYIILK